MHDDDDDYDPDDPETYPDGMYADENLPTVPCPYCHEEVVEDVAACPYCGNYLSREDATPGQSRSLFWVIMMLLALATAAFWAFAG
jgi:hypothetical protein